MAEIIPITVLVLVLFVLGIAQIRAESEQVAMTEIDATANSEIMEADTISKNGRNLKSQTSKGKPKNRSIMSKIVNANKKVEKAVVSAYNTIEDGVVSGYKAIENGVVGGYKKIENKFVETFLTSEEDIIQE